MKIDYHLYQLKFRENYGTVGQGGIRKGALLRVTFEDGLVGYCDCHPWVELGDAPLDRQLSALSHPDKTPLLNCSLKFARIDAKARRDLRSVFDGLSIPPSHLLVSLDQSLHAPVEEGIHHFKLKAGSSLEREIAVMTSWCSAYPNIKLRLDFNERHDRSYFLNYWENVPGSVRRCIDFIEDPYPYNPHEWKEDQQSCQLHFACDHASEKALHEAKSPFIIIDKPAVNPAPQNMDPNARLVVTSYLDHPFGQVCAAYAAARLKEQHPTQVLVCGLLSHLCYENNPFVMELKSKGPFLQPASGTGFGFNHLLEGLPWQNH
jgi:O-succinylbenzoate synthase